MRYAELLATAEAQLVFLQEMADGDYLSSSGRTEFAHLCLLLARERREGVREQVGERTETNGGVSVDEGRRLQAELLAVKARVEQLEAAMPPGLSPGGFIVIDRPQVLISFNHGTFRWSVWLLGGHELPQTFATPAEALAAVRAVAGTTNTPVGQE